jgi:hypothetical protein
MDLLLLLPVELERNSRRIRSVALVDSGATIRVLPFSLGSKFGVDWDSLPDSVSVGGVGGHVNGKLLAVDAYITGFSPVSLLFSWVQTDNYPFVLGQTNFFMLFDVCFYRSQLYFELTLRP